MIAPATSRTQMATVPPCAQPAVEARQIPCRHSRRGHVQHDGHPYRQHIDGNDDDEGQDREPQAGPCVAITWPPAKNGRPEAKTRTPTRNALSGAGSAIILETIPCRARAGLGCRGLRRAPRCRPPSAGFRGRAAAHSGTRVSPTPRSHQPNVRQNVFSKPAGLLPVDWIRVTRHEAEYPGQATYIDDDAVRDDLPAASRQRRRRGPREAPPRSPRPARTATGPDAARSVPGSCAKPP
jgi:hypothetical protein